MHIFEMLLNMYMWEQSGQEIFIFFKVDLMCQTNGDFARTWSNIITKILSY